ncbi:unnamed protein product [Bursaphelenchus xylophilus]|uniref:(pine wood nematode) hypothetical protein n=1 Tax=Bursaphelenchus xylophilus TaxID=6326 RepID=A0A1I7STS3_BURXY|nr:unnamed protein product [Bursaphelenchus xylophilus]CAG9108035.1 unnamed protein product [Bursaphelenchus xylophilus]
MDQPTLGCKFPTIINASESEIPSANRPSLLRRVSQSDPHLDIPHFLSVQDKGLGFHPTLTGLLENSVNFKIGQSSEKLELMDSVPSLPQDLKVPKSSLDRNKSAFELCSSSQAEETPLRKSSSVANYQLDPCIRKETGGFLSSFSSALHLSAGQSHQQQLSKSPEDQGGLTMSVKSSPFSGSSSSSSTPAPATSETASATDPALNRNKSGLMGVFNRGFFAKPVMCNQEENYRYIMALDR